MIGTIGMIGTGNMGSAILRGIVEADYVKAGQIVAYDTSSRRIRELEEDIPGIICARDCIEVAERSDLIILAVKPIYVQDVLDEIKDSLDGKAVLSIAAGWKGGVSVFLGKASVYHSIYDKINKKEDLKITGNQLIDFVRKYNADGYNGNAVGYGNPENS